MKEWWKSMSWWQIANKLKEDGLHMKADTIFYGCGITAFTRDDATATEHAHIWMGLWAKQDCDLCKIATEHESAEIECEGCPIGEEVEK